MISRLLLGLCPLLFVGAPPPQTAAPASLSPVHDCVEIERIEYETRSSPQERTEWMYLPLFCPGPPPQGLNHYYDVIETFVIVRKYETITFGVVGPGGPPILCGSRTRLVSEEEDVIATREVKDLPQWFVDCINWQGQCCFKSSHGSYETVVVEAPTTETVTQILPCGEGEQSIRKVITTTTTLETVTTHTWEEWSSTGEPNCEDIPCELKTDITGTESREKSKVTQTSYPDGPCL